MATRDDDFTFVAEAALRASRTVSLASASVLASTSGGGHALAKHLALAANAVQDRVAERTAEYQAATTEAVKDDAIVELRRVLIRVREFQQTLDWLDYAEDSPLDLGTRYFVEAAARKLVAPDCEVTVVSTTSRSYATTSDPMRPVIDNWGAGIPASEPTVVVVFIPRREERSGLLHPLIVHELGHAADSRHGYVSTIMQRASTRSRLPKKFSDLVTQFAAVQKCTNAEAADRLYEMLRSWIAEMFCDSFAAHFLGPSYLYSFLVEVGAASLDDASVTHPPPRQRIRTILGTLDRLGWTDLMHDQDPALDAWVRETAQVSAPYTGLWEFLTWAMDDLHAVIRKEVERSLGGASLSANATLLDEIALLLAAGIPPSQLEGGAVSRRLVILASWYAAISAEGGGPKALAVAPDSEELAKLMPAALELGALVDAWSAA